MVKCSHKGTHSNVVSCIILLRLTADSLSELVVPCK